MRFGSYFPGYRHAPIRWLAALTCGALLVIALLGWRNGALERDLGSTRKDRAELERQLAEVQGRANTERARLVAADADNQKLIDMISSGAIPGVAVVAKPRLTREAINARYQRAQALEAQGDASGALAEYLWCYDIGFRPHDMVRRLARFGETFLPARQELVERRNRAEARVLANPQDAETMSDVIALNRALGDDSRTIAVYDRLPTSEARRVHGDRSMLETFIINQRYADAMRVLPYEQLKQGLDRAFKVSASRSAQEKAQQEIINASGATEAQRQMQTLAIQRAREAQRKAAIEESAVGVEILAGAGELPKAREIVREILAVDGSTETRALLQKHAARAGHAELLLDESR